MLSLFRIPIITILIPSAARRQIEADRLMVYRDAAVYSAPLGDDGSIGEFKGFFLPSQPPLVQGRCRQDEVHLRKLDHGKLLHAEFRPLAGLQKWSRPARRGYACLLPPRLANLFTGEGWDLSKSFLFPGPRREYSCVALERAARLPIFG